LSSNVTLTTWFRITLMY